MKLYAAALDFRAVAREFGVPETFAPEVHADAAAAAGRRAARTDLRDVPFVTIDPPGSMDLDQAMHLAEVVDDATGAAGWRVLYAIADVGGLIAPDSLVAAEAMRRGQTIYLPDEPTRLHPAALSEDAGSLLPDVDRPAIVWDVVVGADGEPTSWDVYPGLVRSVARLEYMEVQATFDAGDPHPSIAALPELGRARQGSALRREAINLRLPSQTVAPTGDGRWELHLDARPPVMDFNSEISLLAGMVAGQMMAEAGVGVLRTLRPAGEEALAEFRVAARALGYELADGAGVAEVSAFLAGVDADSPRGMAVMKDASRLLRGSGYQRLGSLDDGSADASEGVPVHSGVGGPYAHVTAPLRRLIDRFGLEYCLAIAAHRRGETETLEVPAWVDGGVDEAISSMATSGQLASRVDRACLDLTEAVVLEPWVGHAFDSAVLHDRGEEVEVFVFEPPVFANCRGTTGAGVPPEGSAPRVSLVTADPSNPVEPRVLFAWPAD
ncbi:RNB domain-containing ribonuclease [Corynebacterium xerosis]|uniref:RNB domain-containing ribonuclease n=1 Tax=Corynebacterium xerosis TaxID=1725 RepID=UPI00366FF1ED